LFDDCCAARKVLFLFDVTNFSKSASAFILAASSCVLYFSSISLILVSKPKIASAVSAFNFLASSSSSATFRFSSDAILVNSIFSIGVGGGGGLG
jgi:hypothetical protein